MNGSMLRGGPDSNRSHVEGQGKMRLLHHHAEPLDARVSADEELLQHMSRHELRLLRQSLAAHDAWSRARCPPAAEGGTDVPAPTSARSLPLGALRTDVGKGGQARARQWEAQECRVGAGVATARCRPPLFGKKKMPTPDSDPDSCLAGCFVISARGGATPRPPPPPSPGGVSARAAHGRKPLTLPSLSAAAVSRGEAEEQQFPNDTPQPLAAMGGDAPAPLLPPLLPRAAPSPTAALRELSGSDGGGILRAALCPRRFRGDSGVFGEILVADAAAKPRPSGKARRYTEAFWGQH